MKKVLIVLLIIFYIGTFQKVLAENKILINEFLIDPLPQQVEIINNSTQSADISGYFIDDSGGTTYYTIPQSSILSPNSCLVFDGDFNLNKTSTDTIRLFNSVAPPTSANAILLDSFSYKSSSGSGISYYRLPGADNNWTTGSASLGKYNSEQSISCLMLPSATPSPFPSSKITPTEVLIFTPTPNSPPVGNIYISEAMVNPSSGQKEWIEIYNNNIFDVSLIDWYIDDVENSGSSPKIFSLNIPAKEYGAITLSSSMFNNDGDIIRLLNNDKNQIDSFEYHGSVMGKTFGRSDFRSDDFCEQDSSFELANNNCIYSTLTISPTNAVTPSIIKTTNDKPDVVTTINSPGILIDQKIIITPTTEIGEVLGKTIKRFDDSNILVKNLSATSVAYSLLTLASVLFKMIFIYGKGKEFFFASLRS